MLGGLILKLSDKVTLTRAYFTALKNKIKHACSTVSGILYTLIFYARLGFLKPASRPPPPLTAPPAAPNQLNVPTVRRRRPAHRIYQR